MYTFEAIFFGNIGSLQINLKTAKLGQFLLDEFCVKFEKINEKKQKNQSIRLENDYRSNVKVELFFLKLKTDRNNEGEKIFWIQRYQFGDNFIKCLSTDEEKHHSI